MSTVRMSIIHKNKNCVFWSVGLLSFVNSKCVIEVKISSANVHCPAAIPPHLTHKVINIT